MWLNLVCLCLKAVKAVAKEGACGQGMVCVFSYARAIG